MILVKDIISGQEDKFNYPSEIMDRYGNLKVDTNLIERIKEDIVNEDNKDIVEDLNWLYILVYDIIKEYAS